MTRFTESPNMANGADGLGDPARWAPRLERLLSEQEALCADLDALATSQREMIDSGDAERLLSILTQRQGLLAQLEKSNDELAPFRTHWDECMNRLESDQRDRFNARAEAIMQLFESIAARDEEDCHRLGARRVEVAQRLGEVTRNKSAMSAYGNPRTASPRYQDREG